MFRYFVRNRHCEANFLLDEAIYIGGLPTLNNDTS